jgi:hypothetical protein
MNTSELSQTLGIVPQAVRKAIAKAKQTGANTIKIKGQTVSFCEVIGIGGRGTVYDLTFAEAVNIAPRKQYEKPARQHTKPLTQQTKGAFLRLDKAEQNEVLARIELIKSYVNRPNWMGFNEWAEGKELPTKAHFFKWVSLYRQGVRDQNVLDLFCDRRGRPEGSFKMTKEMREMAERYIVRTDIHPNDVGIYQLMKVAFGTSLPSLDTVCRYLNWYREQNAMTVDYAKNPGKAKNKYKQAFGDASENVIRRNQLWELDGTPADLICSDGVRYTIIAAMDVYSRRVVLTVEPKSNSYALARNLRKAMLELGIPENVKTDNGRDYKSNHFESVLQNFSINKIEVPPYSGELKPHVERFFGTLTRELFSGLEGYVGPDVATRAAIQNQMNFERKLKAIQEWKKQQFTSKKFLEAMTNKKQVMEVFIPLSADELKDWLFTWVKAIYEQRKHRMIKTTPMEKYSSDITPVRVVEDERKLDILLGEWVLMTVGKKGIVTRRDGVEAQYQHIDLIGRIGEKVYVAFGENLGEAYIYDAEMAPVCVAVDASLHGRSREHVKALHREMNKIEREKLKLIQKANKLAQELKDPTVKDVINLAAKNNIAIPKRVQKVEANIGIETIEKEEIVTTLNGKPIFRTDYDAIMYAIQNGKEAEYAELIDGRRELYELAKQELDLQANAG